MGLCVLLAVCMAGDRPPYGPPGPPIHGIRSESAQINVNARNIQFSLASVHGVVVELNRPKGEDQQGPIIHGHTAQGLRTAHRDRSLDPIPLQT